MANLSNLVRTLRQERDKVEGQLSALNAALAAFVGMYKSKPTRKRRRMSAAARKRISLAQKARWRKVKAKRA